MGERVAVRVDLHHRQARVAGHSRKRGGAQRSVRELRARVAERARADGHDELGTIAASPAVLGVREEPVRDPQQAVDSVDRVLDSFRGIVSCNINRVEQQLGFIRVHPQLDVTNVCQPRFGLHRNSHTPKNARSMATAPWTWRWRWTRAGGGWR